MRPRIYKYSNVDKHGDDQVLDYSDDNDGLVVALVCDGVSNCSCGHIAAAFISYYIKEFIKEHFKPGMDHAGYKKLAEDSIVHAATHLEDFAAALHNQQVATHTAINEVPAENFMIEAQPGAVPENEISGPLVLHEEKPVISSQEDIWLQYEKICADLKYDLFAINREKVTRLQEEKKEISFQCTLSMGMVYKTGETSWEILTVHYGDCEFYAIPWDQKITGFFPHYKTSQDVLRDYLHGGGIKGKPVILTRSFDMGDTIVISSDGANLHFTTKGGFPYEPFKKLFTEIKTQEETLKTLPKAWFNYLQKNQAVNDDYSMVVIEFIH